MAAFDELPADQKAVVQLVLRQGRAYEEIANLLQISATTVRERALTALDAIGPRETAGLSDAQQHDIGDYLLGQQDASARAATRELLEASGPARAWARGVTSELQTVVTSPETLPEIPASAIDAEEAFGVQEGARTEPQRSSRLGGWLLIAAVVIIATGLILYAAGAFGGKDDGSIDTATATTATTPAATGARYEQQINLKPPAGSAHPKGLGIATTLLQDGKRELAVIANGLPTSSHYVLWLRNGSQIEKLGFFRPQASSGRSRGTLIAVLLAPADFGSYNEMLITHEPSSAPTQPTTIVLRGPIRRR